MKICTEKFQSQCKCQTMLKIRNTSKLCCQNGTKVPLCARKKVLDDRRTQTWEKTCENKKNCRLAPKLIAARKTRNSTMLKRKWFQVWEIREEFLFLETNSKEYPKAGQTISNHIEHNKTPGMPTRLQLQKVTLQKRTKRTTKIPSKKISRKSLWNVSGNIQRSVSTRKKVDD